MLLLNKPLFTAKANSNNKRTKERACKYHVTIQSEKKTVCAKSCVWPMAARQMCIGRSAIHSEDDDVDVSCIFLKNWFNPGRDRGMRLLYHSGTP